LGLSEFYTNRKVYISVKIKQKEGLNPAFLLAKINAKTYALL
jgi:hypothetical protein